MSVGSSCSEVYNGPEPREKRRVCEALHGDTTIECIKGKLNTDAFQFDPIPRLILVLMPEGALTSMDFNCLPVHLLDHILLQKWISFCRTKYLCMGSDYHQK